MTSLQEQSFRDKKIKQLATVGTCHLHAGLTECSHQHRAYSNDWIGLLVRT